MSRSSGAVGLRTGLGIGLGTGLGTGWEPAAALAGRRGLGGGIDLFGSRGQPRQPGSVRSGLKVNRLLDSRIGGVLPRGCRWPPIEST